MNKRARPESPDAPHRVHVFAALPSPPGSPPFAAPVSPRADARAFTPPPSLEDLDSFVQLSPAPVVRWLLRCDCGVVSFRITTGNCTPCGRQLTILYLCTLCGANRCPGCWLPPPPLLTSGGRPRCEACRLDADLDSLDALARHFASEQHTRNVVEYAHPVRFCSLVCHRVPQARWTTLAEQHETLRATRRSIKRVHGVCKTCGGVLDTRSFK